MRFRARTMSSRSIAALVSAAIVIAVAPSAAAAPWSGTVSLSTTVVSFANSDVGATLTFSASPASTSTYRLMVYDDLGNRVQVANAGLATSTVVVKPAPNTTRTYTAYVATGYPNPGPPTGVQASSGPVSVANVGHVGTLLLTGVDVVTDTTKTQTLSLTNSPAIASPYWLSVYDDTGARLYYSNQRGISYGSLVVTTPVNVTRTYTAYIATDYPNPGPPVTNVASTSAFTITNVGFAGTVTLTTDRNQLDDVNPSAKLAVSVSPGYASPYKVSVYDNHNKRIWYAANGTTWGSLNSVMPPANSTRIYTAYVAQDAPTTGPPVVDVKATSNGVYITSIPAENNLLGVDIAAESEKVLERYAGNTLLVCVTAGETIRVDTDQSSLNNAQTACLQGGVSGLVEWVNLTFGAAYALWFLWQLAHGGTPPVIVVDSPDEPKYPTPVPPAGPSNPEVDDAVVNSLATRIFDNSQTNDGSSLARRLTPEAARVVARACLAQAAAGGGTAQSCGTSSLFIPGFDSFDATVNDIEAITTGRPWRLHFVPNARQALLPGWYNSYRNVLGCSDPRPEYVDCDEYPFYSTNEAGPPGTSLLNPMGAFIDWADSSENRREGGVFGRMASACGFDLTAAAPDGPLGTHFLVVPSLAVPLTTFVCGSNRSNL